MGPTAINTLALRGDEYENVLNPTEDYSKLQGKGDPEKTVYDPDT